MYNEQTYDVSIMWLYNILVLLALKIKIGSHLTPTVSKALMNITFIRICLWIK
jgi:hypothetical protein